MNASKTPETILIVESNDNFGALIVHELFQRGMVVELVADGRTAVSRCGAQAYAALVVDLNTANCRQLSFIRTIKQADRALPVIVISAFASPEAIAFAAAVGADEFIEKPCQLDAVGDRIQARVRHERPGFGDFMGSRP